MRSLALPLLLLLSGCTGARRTAECTDPVRLSRETGRDYLYVYLDSGFRGGSVGLDLRPDSTRLDTGPNQSAAVPTASIRRITRPSRTFGPVFLGALVGAAGAIALRGVFPETTWMPFAGVILGRSFARKERVLFDRERGGWCGP